MMNKIGVFLIIFSSFSLWACHLSFAQVPAPSLSVSESWLSDTVAENRDKIISINWSYRDENADRVINTWFGPDSHVKGSQRMDGTIWADVNIEATSRFKARAYTKSLTFQDCNATLVREWDETHTIATVPQQFIDSDRGYQLVTSSVWTGTLRSEKSFDNYLINSYSFNLKDIIPSTIKAIDVPPTKIKDGWCDDDCTLHWVTMKTRVDKVVREDNQKASVVEYSMPTANLTGRMVRAWHDAVIACGATELEQAPY
jgi:hypothetical protein